MNLSRHLTAAAILAALGACTSGDATHENQGAMGTEVEAERCGTTICFPFHLEQDASFVAVHAEDCPGALRTVEVFQVHGDGTRVPLDLPQTTVGDGCACEGEIDPTDVLIEGIHACDVEVCVNYLGVAEPGDVTVHVGAGDVCIASETHDGICTACGEESSCDGSCGATPCDGSCGATPCDGSCGATPCDGSCGESAGEGPKPDKEKKEKKPKKEKKEKKPKKEKKHDHDGDGHDDHDAEDCPEPHEDAWDDDDHEDDEKED